MANIQGSDTITSADRMSGGFVSNDSGMQQTTPQQVSMPQSNTQQAPNNYGMVSYSQDYYNSLAEVGVNNRKIRVKRNISNFIYARAEEDAKNRQREANNQMIRQKNWELIHNGVNPLDGSNLRNTQQSAITYNTKQQQLIASYQGTQELQIHNHAQKIYNAYGLAIHTQNIGSLGMNKDVLNQLGVDSASQFNPNDANQERLFQQSFGMPSSKWSEINKNQGLSAQGSFLFALKDGKPELVNVNTIFKGLGEYVGDELTAVQTYQNLAARASASLTAPDKLVASDNLLKGKEETTKADNSEKWREAQLTAQTDLQKTNMDDSTKVSIAELNSIKTNIQDPIKLKQKENIRNGLVPDGSFTQDGAAFLQHNTKPVTTAKELAEHNKLLGSWWLTIADKLDTKDDISKATVEGMGAIIKTKNIVQQLAPMLTKYDKWGPRKFKKVEQYIYAMGGSRADVDDYNNLIDRFNSELDPLYIAAIHMKFGASVTGPEKQELDDALAKKQTPAQKALFKLEFAQDAIKVPAGLPPQERKVLREGLYNSLASYHYLLSLAANRSNVKKQYTTERIAKGNKFLFGRVNIGTPLEEGGANTNVQTSWTPTNPDTDPLNVPREDVPSARDTDDEGTFTPTSTSQSLDSLTSSLTPSTTENTTTETPTENTTTETPTENTSVNKASTLPLNQKITKATPPKQSKQELNDYFKDKASSAEKSVTDYLTGGKKNSTTPPVAPQTAPVKADKKTAKKPEATQTIKGINDMNDSDSNELGSNAYFEKQIKEAKDVANQDKKDSKQLEATATNPTELDDYAKDVVNARKTRPKTKYRRLTDATYTASVMLAAKGSNSQDTILTPDAFYNKGLSDNGKKITGEVKVNGKSAAIMIDTGDSGIGFNSGTYIVKSGFSYAVKSFPTSKPTKVDTKLPNGGSYTQVYYPKEYLSSVNKENISSINKLITTIGKDGGSSTLEKGTMFKDKGKKYVPLYPDGDVFEVPLLAHKRWVNNGKIVRYELTYPTAEQFAKIAPKAE